MKSVELDAEVSLVETVVLINDSKRRSGLPGFHKQNSRTVVRRTRSESVL